MPLSLSNRDQNSGHLFYNRRLRSATTRFSVRMKHDDRKQTAALALSMVLVAIAAGWMMRRSSVTVTPGRCMRAWMAGCTLP
jgi:Type VII secretion system ESX-1, transport TM domain B